MSGLLSRTVTGMCCWARSKARTRPAGPAPTMRIWEAVSVWSTRVGKVRTHAEWGVCISHGLARSEGLSMDIENVYEGLVLPVSRWRNRKSPQPLLFFRMRLDTLLRSNILSRIPSSIQGFPTHCAEMPGLRGCRGLSVIREQYDPIPLTGRYLSTGCGVGTVASAK